MDKIATRVLIVEDDLVQLKILQRSLMVSSAMPFETREANTLADALRLIDHEKLNVILLDLNLPDIRGIDTVVKVVEKAKDTPIVVITGDDDENLGVEALRQGAQDYLVKGQTHEKTILRVLRYAIERKTIEAQLKYINQRLEQSNRELKNAQMKLIQTAKLEVLGRLAAGVAHEVKNPLSIIAMGIDYLSRGFTHDEERRGQIIQSMSKAIQRADTVIREMLDFSSPQELTLKPENLEQIIDHAIGYVKHELEKNNIKTNKL